MDTIKMGIGFGLWPACHSSQRLPQWAFDAEEMIPHFAETETPAVSSASTT